MGFLVTMILGGAIALLAGVFIYAAILLWLLKIFKIAGPTYKKCLVITVLEGVVTLFVVLILYLIGLVSLATVLSIIVSYLVLYYLLKKYYQVSWQKSLGLYVTLSVIGYIVSVVLSVVIIMPIRGLIGEPFYVKGSTMSPNYNDRDYLWISKTDTNYQRGDVVIHKYPKDKTQSFIKRIVGLPGEDIKIADGRVYVNGKVLSEDYIPQGVQTFSISNNSYSEIKLGTDQFYVLGDNRSQSLDSRIFGPISREDIVGKVISKVISSSK